MSDGSPIEWLNRPGTKPATWNPIIAWRDVPQPDGGVKRLRGWHCEHVHEGCTNCYAETQNKTGRFLGTRLPYKPGHRGEVTIELHEPTLLQPLQWKSPRTIFVCSMTDLYGAWVKDEWLDKIKSVQALTPQHTYIELTKRPERMKAYALAKNTRQRIDIERAVTSGGAEDNWLCTARWPIPNVWGLVSCSTQDDINNFYPHLRDTPLAVRGISAEPLLGPIHLELGWRKLDWVILGGESGRNARPMHPNWARALQQQCETTGVAFFFKQWGEYVSVSEVEGVGAHFSFPDGATVRKLGKKAAGRLLDGRAHNGFPLAPELRRTSPQARTK